MHLPSGLRRHIEACNNITLPGGRTRLRLGGIPIGWIAPETDIAPDLPDLAALTAAIGRLAATGAFTRRGEPVDLRADTDGTVLGQVDRGCTPLLGITMHNAHLNGLVRRADGIHVWVARRAAHKPTAPGKLDNITAGGIPAGLTAREALVKEAGEEAGIPAALAERARPTPTISYIMQRPEGLRRETLHCFDLDLPEDFRPTPVDGEVESFSLLPIAELARLVEHTETVMYDVNLVLIDLFVRLGVIRTGPAADPGCATTRTGPG